MRKIWIISDTHFGARNASKEWLSIMTDYFDNFFIPLVQSEANKEDILIHMGDVFDNRQSINLNAMHEAIRIFEDLSKRFKEIHVLVGNHDIAKKLTNEITSVDIFKWFPNIIVHKDPYLMNIDGKNCLLMPWRYSTEHESESYEYYIDQKINYVFCHSEVRGVKMSLNPQNTHDHGNTSNFFSRFDRVYSGHIHFGQRVNNILFVGNPYEMTRSDRGNQKGIYTICPSTDEESFYPNNYSPKFKKYDILQIANLTIEEIRNEFKNNFIDISISSKIFPKINTSLFMSALEGYARKIETNIYETNDDSAFIEEMTTYLMDNYSFKSDSHLDIFSITKDYINSLGYEDEVKTRLWDNFQSIYNKMNNNED